MPLSEPPDFLGTMIISVIASILSAYYAQTKGRSPLAWLFIGFLISFFALIILYFLPSLKEADSANQFASNKANPRISPVPTSFLSTIADDSDQNKLWYYLDQNHNQYGPVSIIALKELWDTGRLDLNSYVWSDGMEEWKKVDELPKLKDVFHKTLPLI